MKRKRVLVFPCGSEIALEIYRSLKNSTHFELIGANSVSDHGRFVFENYIGDVPFVTDERFIPAIKEIVRREQIDFLYPAMDSVITRLKAAEEELGCAVISSPKDTTEICLSKEKTYKALSALIKTPRVYTEGSIPSFPVFCKPEVGYGSRGTKKITDEFMLRQHLAEFPDSMILEYLPGEEYTVDCFTDRNGKLIFCGARSRNRISNGISVNTSPMENDGEFRKIAEIVNENLRFRGAWFLQLKRDTQGELVLLELASRLGGSSALFRARGVNFAQLSLFDMMDIPVGIIDNGYEIEMDRALDNRYKINIRYDEVFMDFDDTLILEKEKYNTQAMSFVLDCINRGIRVSLLTCHHGDLEQALERFHLKPFFDRVIHVKDGETKADHIDNTNAIFIDDSYAERLRVRKKSGIPVFSVDMLEVLK